MAAEERPLEWTTLTLDELAIEDEPSFRAVGLYRDLKEILRREKYRFRVLPERYRGRWDRALLLNLTFWTPAGQGDVLLDASIPADVIAHAAWHHLVSAVVEGPEAPAVESLLLGEAIASAFDVYLVGRLLESAPESAFLETQLPQLLDTASEADLSPDDFQALLAGIARAPEEAFESLRQLLFDASRALHRSSTAEEALAALAPLDDHRYSALLHRFELSSWVLHARSHGSATGSGPRALAIDQALRQASVSLDWLSQEWVLPRLR